MSLALIEAACLAALAALPLVMNPFSARVFEPEKAGALRALAMLIAALAVVRLATAARRDAGGARWLVPVARPRGWEWLALAVGAYVPAMLLSTAASVTPAASLWGSYARAQGAWTTIACVVVFAALVATVRRRAERERVLAVMILASVPVALYAVVQALGLDPHTLPATVQARVTSTQGNASFLGGYLAMLVPLTLHAGLAPAAAPESRGRRVGRALVFLAVAGLQVVALVLAARRGPVLALAAGLVFGAAAGLVAASRRRLALAVLAAGLVAAAALAVFQAGGAGARGAGPGRLAGLLDPTTASSRVRILLWDGVARLVALPAPLALADGRADPWHRLRPLLGYGPESLLVVFPAVHPPALAAVEYRDRLPDRAHNEIWEVLATGGLLGLAAHLGLWLAVFHLGLRHVGAGGGRGLVVLALAGGGLGALAAAAWGGPAFAAPGLAMGVVAGLAASLARAAGRGDGEDAPPSTGDRLLAVALLATLVVHFVETQVGLTTVTTRLAFWAAAAVLVTLGRAEARAAAGAAPAGRGDGVVLGLLAALALATLVHALVANPDARDAAGAIVRRTFAGGTGVVLVGTWLAGGLVAAVATRPGRGAAPVAVVLAIAAAGGGLALVLHAAGLAALAGTAPRDAAAAMANGIAVERMLAWHWLGALLVLGGVGWALARRDPRPPRSAVRALAVGAAVALAAVAAVRLELRPLRADVALRSADDLTERGRAAEATVFFARAVALAPAEAQAWSMTARGLHGQATAKGIAPERREALMTEALAAARAAHLRDPAHPGHVANLGRLWLWWARATPDPVPRTVRAALAEEHFARALAAMPNDARLWTERAALHREVLARPASARAFAVRAAALDPRYEPARTLLADLERAAPPAEPAP